MTWGTVADWVQAAASIGLFLLLIMLIRDNSNLRGRMRAIEREIEDHEERLNKLRDATVEGFQAWASSMPQIGNTNPSRVFTNKIRFGYPFPASDDEDNRS